MNPRTGWILSRRNFGSLTNCATGALVLVATAYMDEAGMVRPARGSLDAGRWIATARPGDPGSEGRPRLRRAFIRRGAAVNEPAVPRRTRSVRFGAFTAVDRVSPAGGARRNFRFPRRQRCGKTTTIRVLTGLWSPRRAAWRSRALLRPGADAIKARVGYMSQKFTLYTDLTVGENLSSPPRSVKSHPACFERTRALLTSLASATGPTRWCGISRRTQTGSFRRPPFCTIRK